MYNVDIVKIFEDESLNFKATALEIFRQQYDHNPLYKQFTDLTASPNSVSNIHQIPFLPISFFKTHSVKTTEFSEQIVFESSGTTGNQTSRHLIKDTVIYEASFINAFQQEYGAIRGYCILALLPSYIERGNSSLVYMAQKLIDISSHPKSGFFLNDYEKLHETLQELEKDGQITLLIGVTYALLDFAKLYPSRLDYTIIMETGGMKGRKKELLREEIHAELMSAFSVSNIHSEYGMTELLSQAYAYKNGRFRTPPWMKVLIGEEDDPKSLLAETEAPKTGVLHIIDLANLYSCSFIATQDLGRLHPDGSFEVLGRIDHTDIRGCSLLAL